MHTRKRILDTVGQLLSQKKLSEIRVQDICSACDISKSTFYLHFKDKYDAANTYYYQSILMNGIILDDTVSYEERRLKLVQFYQENSSAILHLLHEGGQDSLLDFVIKEVHPISSSEMIKRYNVTPSEDTECLLLAILMGQISCIQHWMESECPFSAEKMRDMLLAMEEGTILQYYEKVQ